VFTVGQQWASVVNSSGGGVQANSHADDLAEGSMLDRFLTRLEDLVSSYLTHAGPAQPHFYFTSSHQARFLLTRLSHLASISGHTNDAARAAKQQLCWVQGLLGANPMFEGEQVLVSYLEIEAKTRYAWHSFGFDLYTLSQHVAGSLAASKNAVQQGHAATPPRRAVGGYTGAPISSNQNEASSRGGLRWGSRVEQLLQVESNETGGLHSMQGEGRRYNETDVLWVAGCTALSGVNGTAAGGSPQRPGPPSPASPAPSSTNNARQKRVLLGAQGVAASWFWAHHHLQQANNHSDDSRSAATDTWASLPHKSQQEIQSKLQLIANNPGLLLHVLCKQVQAMAWVERLLQLTAAASAHPQRGVLAQLASPAVRPVLLAAATVSPDSTLSLHSRTQSNPSRKDLSQTEFQAMIRRAAEPVWSLLAGEGSNSAEDSDRAVAAALRLLCAARDAVLLEYGTARSSWQADITVRCALGVLVQAPDYCLYHIPITKVHVTTCWCLSSAAELPFQWHVYSLSTPAARSHAVPHSTLLAGLPVQAFPSGPLACA
jgi:hypothetical protein